MNVNEYYSNLIKRAIAGERGDVKCMVFLKHGFDYIIPWELNGKEMKLRKLYKVMQEGKYPYPNLSDYDKVSLQVLFKNGTVREYVIYKDRTMEEFVYLAPDSVLLWFGIAFNSGLSTEAYLDILNMFHKVPEDIPEGEYLKASAKIPNTFPVYFAWEKIICACEGCIDPSGIPDALLDCYAGWTGSDFARAEEDWELANAGIWNRSNPPGQLCEYPTAEALVKAYLPIKELQGKLMVSAKSC